MKSEDYAARLKSGNRRELARLLSIAENNLPGSDELLAALSPVHVPVVGITGPPGAGKSSLLNALASDLLSRGKKLAVLAVDPSSPFSQGSILGDRIRLSEHFTNPGIFIRSMASRGSLGGLSPRIFELTDILKNAGFDYIFIETVGVGQSEIEIAGLADTTCLVLVPEAGDEVQTIKSGVMEIADIYVVNKADRDGADSFVKNLHMLLHERKAAAWNPPVIKTVATKNEGIKELISEIDKHSQFSGSAERKLQLMAEKAIFLIRQERMKKIDRNKILKELEANLDKADFNLYSFARNYPH